MIPFARYVDEINTDRISSSLDLTDDDEFSKGQTILETPNTKHKNISPTNIETKQLKAKW
jgi:hypothetical protein